MAFDSNFEDVVLLLHFDGAHGSTTFSDSSGYDHTVTAYGDARLDTSEKIWGTASGLFDTAVNPSYAIVTDDAMFDMSGDFTIEWWMNPDSFASYGGASRCPLSFGSTGLSATSPAILLATDGRVIFYTTTSLLTTTNALLLFQWNHVAVVRSGATLTIYVNGVSGGSVSYTATISPPNICLAKSYSTYGYYDGWIDDLRITVGTARYIANFTVPTEAFPDSAGIIVQPSLIAVYSNSVGLLRDALIVDTSPLTVGSPSITLKAPLVVETTAIEVGSPNIKIGVLLYANTSPIEVGTNTINFWDGVAWETAAVEISSGSVILATTLPVVSTAIEVGTGTVNLISIFPIEATPIEITSQGVALLISTSYSATLVMNCATSALSENTGTLWGAAKGIASFNDEAYLLTTTGLFKQVGDDDDGTALSPYLLTGDLTLAGDVEYNIPKCAFTAHGAGSITVTRYIKRTGSAETMTAYSATLTEEVDRHELGLENMTIARAWQFKVAFSSPEFGDALEDFSVYVNPARPRKHG